MKRKLSIKIAAIICIAAIALAAASCEKVGQLFNGFKDDLVQQLQNELGGDSQEVRGDYDFVTHDIDGNVVKLTDFSSAKVVMLNYWEPWCPPCIRELPELEQLYEDYKDKGLVIIGVFSSTDMDADARQLISQNGLTYPVVRYEDNLKKYSPSAVPTTLFINANGDIIAEEVVGANDYSGWKAIVDKLLG